MAMLFVGSDDVEGAGALRFTTFVGPVRAAACTIGFVGDDTLTFDISLSSTLDFKDFGRSFDLLDFVLVT